MKGELKLSGMKFHAYHGCLDFEREKGADYLVDFQAEIELDKAARTDSLEDTLDYSRIYDIVKEEMSIPSNLIENVTARIFRAIEKAFPNLEHFSIRLSKLAPPVGGESESAQIYLSR